MHPAVAHAEALAADTADVVPTTEVDATGSTSATVADVADVVTAATVTQEGYRFYNDNATEGADPVDVQDTPITFPAATTVGLRVLLDYDGIPSSQVPRLQYRKVGNPDWKDVPVP